jgi:hypothetical protein
MKKISYKVALGGVLAAVALLIMFTTGLAPFLTYVAPMFAGMLAIMMMVEVSYGWATLTYAAVAILCILVTPDREAAFLYIFFFGYYPIVKGLIEKIKNGVLRWILKFVVFNVSTVTCYFLIINLFGMKDVFDSLNSMGKYGLLIFWAAANFTFLIYDNFLNSVAIMYVTWFRTKFLRKKK